MFCRHIKNSRHPEFNSYHGRKCKVGGELIFGRVTYEMMKSFWPTENARKMFPVVAEQMNKAKKIVFSRSLDEADWNNTRLIKGDLAEEVRKLKDALGDTLVIMGSGSLVAQLTNAHLIDEYQMIMNPIALGEGRTMFDGVKEKLNLKLTATRAFKNGNVLMSYEAAAKEASAYFRLTACYDHKSVIPVILWSSGSFYSPSWLSPILRRRREHARKTSETNLVQSFV